MVASPLPLKLFVLAGLLLGAQAAQAQTPATSSAAAPPCSSISGHVSGNGKPMAGVTVSVRGTRLLTITNGEGYFTLATPDVVKPTLELSAAGYESQTVPVAACTPLDLELALLPGTRIKQHGKRKGFIMKTSGMDPKAQ